MAKEEFDVSHWKSKKDTEYTEKGPVKKQTIIFKGVDKNGISTTITISGLKSLIEAKFAAFPLGSGIILKVILSTTQQTLTSKLAKTTKAKKVAKAKGNSIAILEDELIKATES